MFNWFKNKEPIVLAKTKYKISVAVEPVELEIAYLVLTDVNGMKHDYKVEQGYYSNYLLGNDERLNFTYSGGIERLREPTVTNHPISTAKEYAELFIVSINCDMPLVIRETPTTTISIKVKKAEIVSYGKEIVQCTKYILVENK